MLQGSYSECLGASAVLQGCNICHLTPVYQQLCQLFEPNLLAENIIDIRVFLADVVSSGKSSAKKRFDLSGLFCITRCVHGCNFAIIICDLSSGSLVSPPEIICTLTILMSSALVIYMISLRNGFRTFVSGKPSARSVSLLEYASNFVHLSPRFVNSTNSFSFSFLDLFTSLLKSPIDSFKGLACLKQLSLVSNKVY